MSAKEAFKSYTRAYDSHQLKTIFDVDTLDLLKVGKSFGFTTPPSIDLRKPIYMCDDLFETFLVIYTIFASQVYRGTRRTTVLGKGLEAEAMVNSTAWTDLIGVEEGTRRPRFIDSRSLEVPEGPTRDNSLDNVDFFRWFVMFGLSEMVFFKLFM